MAATEIPWDWHEIEADFERSGLLLGNGASISVWPGFAYDSLYEEARRGSIRHPLAGDEHQVFTALDTTDFETVLNALATTRTVNGALDLDRTAPMASYRNVRRALAEAVHVVHPRWELVEPILRDLRRVLRSHSRVFTTNYDLLVYWAIMIQAEGGGFKDGFWGSRHTFDLLNAAFTGADTRVFYLHGGLHLERSEDGRARKRTGHAGGGLLATFGDFEARTTPLFVSEGDARQKAAVIAGSDYLSFALGELEEGSGPLVLFGHSLSAPDRHITDAIKASAWDPIAVSAFNLRPDRLRARINALRRNFGARKDVYVFDATTHPLGDSKLRRGTP